jgi:hypothetical protein
MRTRLRQLKLARRTLGTGAMLGWTLVALLAFGADLGHWVLLSHSLCAAHGEVVHEQHGHAHDAANDASPHARKPFGASASLAGLEADASSDDDHDHCSAVTKDAALSVVRAPEAATLLSWQLIAWRPIDFSAARSRLFLLAPKTSPPAAS